jgi:hypothetical protein
MAFAHRLAQSASIVNSQRADGYSEQSAAIICQFQRDIEVSPNANYNALRAALKWAREQQHFTYEAIARVYLAHC